MRPAAHAPTAAQASRPQQRHKTTSTASDTHRDRRQHVTTGAEGRLIEAQFGPLRTFTMGASDHPNHPALTRRMQAYLRWRNTHARHPDVLAEQRRERARIRSERHRRWGRPRAS